MLRISAIFIAVCMVLIAGSLGVVVYLRFGLTGAEFGAGRARRAHRTCPLQHRCRPPARSRRGERSDRDAGAQLGRSGAPSRGVRPPAQCHGEQGRVGPRKGAGDGAAARRRNRGTLDAGEAARRVPSRRTTLRSAAGASRIALRRPPSPPAPPPGLAIRLPRRSSARSPPSAGSTGAASLPRSAAPSTPTGSISTCSPS